MTKKLLILWHFKCARFDMECPQSSSNIAALNIDAGDRWRRLRQIASLDMLALDGGLASSGLRAARRGIVHGMASFCGRGGHRR
jgi:hypothetical protein